MGNSPDCDAKEESPVKKNGLLYDCIVASLPQLTGAELCNLKVAIVEQQMKLEDELVEVAALEMQKGSTTPCKYCDGCGKVDDTSDHAPKTFWDKLPEPSKVALKLGLVKFVDCTHCKGTGLEVAAVPTAGLWWRRAGG